jgi:hypothetical protein
MKKTYLYILIFIALVVLTIACFNFINLNSARATENTRCWYEKEQRLSSIFFSAAAVAIVLSCLGLFALVSLMLEQWRKEIGLRKVLGASITSISSLLSKEFLKLSFSLVFFEPLVREFHVPDSNQLVDIPCSRPVVHSHCPGDHQLPNGEGFPCQPR